MKMKLHFPDTPPPPYDDYELSHIERWISKIPIYNEKINELSEKIEALSEKANEKGAFYSSLEIEKMIYRAFYIELENREYKKNDKDLLMSNNANIVHEGVIKQRNIPCEVCGENRSIDRCHIIPAQLGGTKTNPNLLYLCPTHHRLFDRFMLTEEEWNRIDWLKKDKESQQYTTLITLEAMKKFWKNLSDNKYRKIKTYESDDVQPFYKYVTHKLIDIIFTHNEIEKNELLKSVSIEIKEISKKIIKDLIKKKIILSEKRKSKIYLSMQIEPNKAKAMIPGKNFK